MLPDFRDSIAVFEVFQASPACPSDNNSITWKWTRSIGGIILWGEHLVVGGKLALK